MENIEELSGIFKALSDPTRLKIIKLLSLCKNADCNSMLCVNALTSKLKVTQSAVSQHLRVLKQANLVKAERRGYFMHYTVNYQRIKIIKNLLKESIGVEL